MNNGFRVFRVTPSFKDPTDYINWLNKIEKAKAQTWKDMGIYDLIMLSKVGLEYSPSLLVYSLYFWDNTHYTFHLPCGMVTSTLFEVAAITGLKPTGHVALGLETSPQKTNPLLEGLRLCHKKM